MDFIIAELYSSGGTSWFAGIRLGSGRGSSKMKPPSLSTNTQGSGDARISYQVQKISQKLIRYLL